MESSKKIITNCDVLQSIFRYLDFEEHLKLVKICPQFEYAILHGAWRLMCKNLCFLHSSPEGDVILRYKTKNNVKITRPLKPETIHTILHHSSMYINKLELNYIDCLENIISFNYHHLTELTLCGTIVEDAHLQQVAKNCFNLQSFTLICFTKSKIQSNIRANTFCEMKALNKLEINDIKFTSWNYFDVQQLFCLGHLKTLRIKINIRDSNDNNISNYNSTDRVCNIENLTIGMLPYLQSENICFIKDLIRLENLTKLSITLSRKSILSLDNNVLTEINNACPKLCVEDNFDYNYTSNTLETLTIRNGFDQNIVRTFFNRQHKFKNVSKVRLEIGAGRWSPSIELCFSHNFPYLQELIMDLFYISSEDILHLKHLKELQFKLFDDMSWSYLEILFKHPTLTHITIKPINSRDYDVYPVSVICCDGLTTTLEYLGLPSEVYETYLNFWPFFKQRNKLLKLKIIPYRKRCHVLQIPSAEE